MATTADAATHGDPPAARVAMDHKVHAGATAIFLLVLVAGLAFLGLALLIALGFEFVNGFHDTANAVATVIYTHSLEPVFAVIWSGCWNFIGVMTSTGAVAYTVITLLPVDLILNVGSAGCYAMIFALLLAAATKNLRNEMYVVYDTLRLMTKDGDKAKATFPNGGEVSGRRDVR